MAIAALATLHDVAITAPVAGAQAVRNDDVERPSDRLRLRMAEHPLGARIPEEDQPVAVRGHDRVRLGRQDGALENALAIRFHASHPDQACCAGVAPHSVTASGLSSRTARKRADAGPM